MAAILNHWSAEAQHCTSTRATESLNGVLDCMERLRPMLHRKLIELDVHDEHDGCQILVDEPIVKTINNASADIKKRWYFYTKSLRVFCGEWVNAYKLKMPDGRLRELNFSDAIGVNSKSLLLSFSGNPSFPAGKIRLSGADDLEFEIGNSSSKVELENELLRYEAHSKKHHPNSRGNVSPMDLKDDLAQRVLDCSIAVEGWGRIGCYKRSFYEFFPTSGDVFHGWRMPAAEIEKLPEVVRAHLLLIDSYERPS